MLLKQYYLGCLAHASYLIADAATGTVVVDPQRDIAHYLQDATQHGCHIRYTFLTDFHADFHADHLELRERVGATICLGAQVQAEYAFSDPPRLIHPATTHKTCDVMSEVAVGQR